MAIAYDDDSTYATLVFAGPAVWPKPEVTTSFAFASNGGEVGLSLLAQVIALSWEDNLQDVTDNQVTLARVRTERATTAYELPFAVAGQGDFYSPTANTSILVSKKTDVKGPRGRGRSYFPGLANAASIQQTGDLTPIAVGTLQGLVTAFIEQIETEGAGGVTVTHVLPQTTFPGEQSPPNLPWPEVTSIEVSGRVSTQRRRMR